MPVEPNAPVNSSQILTVIHGKSTTVLEMEHDIVDFITLCESPYEADCNDPYAILVLLSKDLVLVDLQTNGYVCAWNRSIYSSINPLIFGFILDTHAS